MKNKTYYNQYAYFIRRVLKRNNLNVNKVCVSASIPKNTFYDIASGKTKKINHKTLVKIVTALGYYDLKYFIECFEQFEKYGIIVKPQQEDDFTPLEVTIFCSAILLVAGLIYFIVK